MVCTSYARSAKTKTDDAQMLCRSCAERQAHKDVIGIEAEVIGLLTPLVISEYLGE